MKRKLTLVLTLTLILLQGRAQSSFDREFINVGQIGLSLTNAGTVGWPDVRNNPQGPPSMEYPLNSGIEHLFEGGLWIGAKSMGKRLSLLLLWTFRQDIPPEHPVLNLRQKSGSAYARGRH